MNNTKEKKETLYKAEKNLTISEISDSLMSYNERLYNLQYDCDTKKTAISDNKNKTREGKLC